MAKELLSPQLTSGYTYYSLIFSTDGQVFNGTTFEDYVDANYSTYAVAMTELGTASGIYAADLPGALSASTRYSYMIFHRYGGSPAITDAMEAQGVLGDVLDEEVETGFTLRRTLRIIAASAAGKVTGGPSGPVFRNLSDTADQITGVATTDGNRTTATYGP